MNADELFHQARALPAEQRTAWLHAHCTDPTIRDQLLRRLSALDEATITAPGEDATGAYDPHATGAYHAKASTEPAHPTHTRTSGVVAGRYTLLKVIGEGGMGSVYLASQTEPVKRQVALKLIKAGMDSKNVLARFDAERQALALMDHPNIARIYDGGVTEQGQPFFVMELVQGVPLTDYCDAKRLSIDARLQLFVAICQAIQHAHQKGIIHRDLKPGNVLVTEVDGKPTPKVIDFGVAKATEQKLTDQSVADVGAIVGTPAYMSPEQADPTSADIDTRTDVYALGVMLYELLAGSPPIDTKQFQRGALLEMLRMVREVEPPRPSTKLSSAEGLPNIAANRNIEPAKLTRLLQIELDWIVLKALEKDRGRRYDSANGFAADVQRYLAGEPVLAHPPSRAYRLRKFLRRNRGPVLAVSVLLVALLAGIVGTSLGLVQARQAWQAEAQRADEENKQRRRAETAEVAEAKRADAEKQQRERAEGAEADAKKQRNEALDQLALAESLSNFMRNDILAQASQRQQAKQMALPKPNLTVREALDRAANGVGSKFKDRPRVEANIRHTLGVAYREVSANQPAVEQLTKAYKLRKQVLGADHDDTLNTMSELSEALLRANKPKDALDLRQELLRRCTAHYGPAHEATESALHNLAATYHQMGKYDDAIKLYEQIRDERLSKRGIDHPSSLITLVNLATVYADLGQPAKAIKIYEQVHEKYAHTFGAGHPDTIMLMATFGAQLCESDQKERGLKMLEQASSNGMKLLGRDRYETLLARNNYAQNLGESGDLKKAATLLEEVLVDARTVLGKDHSGTLMIMHNLGITYISLERTDEGIKLLEEVGELRIATLGLQHPQTINGFKNLGYLCWLAKQFDRAIPAFQKMLDGCRKEVGDNHTAPCFAAMNLAFNYRDNKQPEEARKVLNEWLPRAMLLEQFDPRMLRAALHAALTLNIEANDVASLKPIAERFLKEARKSKPKEERTYAGELALVGLALTKCGDPSAAEDPIREAIAIRERIMPDLWQTFSTYALLGNVYLSQKKYAEAEPLLVKGYEGLKAREKMIPPQGLIRIPETLDQLIALATATNKPDDVKKYRDARSTYPDPKKPAEKKP